MTANIHPLPPLNLLVATLVTGCLGCGPGNPQPPPRVAPRVAEHAPLAPEPDADEQALAPAVVTPIVVVTPDQLEEEFKTDAPKAVERYRNTLVELIGVVNARRGYTDQPGREVTLKTKESKGWHERDGIDCRCVGPKLAGKVGIGQTVRLRGVVHKGYSRPFLTDCKVIEIGKCTIIHTTPDGLIDDLVSLDDAAEQKYRGKTVQMTGVITYPDVPGPTSVLSRAFVIKTNNGGVIKVELGGGDTDLQKDFKAGQAIKFSGEPTWVAPKSKYIEIWQAMLVEE